MPSVLHKRSSTPGATPASGALTVGELALNTADGKLFTKKDSGAVVEIGALAGLSNDDHPQYALTSGSTRANLVLTNPVDGEVLTVAGGVLVNAAPAAGSGSGFAFVDILS